MASGLQPVLMVHALEAMNDLLHTQTHTTKWDKIRFYLAITFNVYLFVCFGNITLIALQFWGVVDISMGTVWLYVNIMIKIHIKTPGALTNSAAK